MVGATKGSGVTTLANPLLRAGVGVGLAAPNTESMADWTLGGSCCWAKVSVAIRRRLKIWVMPFLESIMAVEKTSALL